MSKEMNMLEIVNRLKTFQEEYGQGIEPADYDALSIAINLLSNMTNLQMCLYDKGSLGLAAEVLSCHSCFDDTTGTLIPSDKSDCNGCMFDPTLEEGADGVDCPDKFRPWLMKKITEV